MNISKIRIIAAVRRELNARYKSFPAAVRDEAIDNLIPFLERLPATWYDALPEPKHNTDSLITEIVRDGIATLHPELIDKASRH